MTKEVSITFFYSVYICYARKKAIIGEIFILSQEILEKEISLI